MIKKLFVLLYGIVAYAGFVAVFGYTILFIGNIYVTPSLDTINQGGLLQALLIDTALLAAFALQHSVMARPAFKKAISGFIPRCVERSTYVLSSSILLGILVYFWQPLGGMVWQITNPVIVDAIYTLFALGWAILFLASIQINHFDLFGLRQTWLHFRGKPYTELKFETPWLYRYVRHPLYLGMIIGLWSSPTMTVAHLVFAALSTAYIFIGARLEENDLCDALPEYRQYREEVPMIVPFAGSKQTAQAEPH